MPRKKKIYLEEAELNLIKAANITYENIVKEFGLISIQKLELDQQVKTIESRELKANEALVNLQKYREDTFEKLREKYGDGNIDINTGEFTPVK